MAEIAFVRLESVYPDRFEPSVFQPVRPTKCMAGSADDIEELRRLGGYESRDEVLDDAIRTLLRRRPELRIELALEKYRTGSVSRNRAAELAGLSSASFADLLDEGVCSRISRDDEPITVDSQPRRKWVDSCRRRRGDEIDLIGHRRVTPSDRPRLVGPLGVPANCFQRQAVPELDQRSPSGGSHLDVPESLRNTDDARP